VSAVLPDSPRRRILHLAPFLEGGAGRAIVDLVGEQDRAGHEVTVVVSGTGVPGHGNSKACLDILTTMGIRLRLVDSMFERAHGPNLAVVAALDGMFRPGHEPDVMHTHAAIPSLVALLFAGSRRARIGIVQTMHGWGVVTRSDQIATDVSVLNLVDRVIAPSAPSAGMLASLGVAPSRIEMVPYGVPAEGTPLDAHDEDTVHEMARARRHGRFIVACAGTGGPRPPQALLVDALGRIPETPVLAVVIGEGAPEELAAAIEAGDDGRDRLRLHGYSRAARRLVAAADLLVVPGGDEGRTIPVLEAFCDGTLVAVADEPELATLVEQGAMGAAFQAGNAAALATTIVDFVGLPNSTRRAMRESARARYASQFTVQGMAGRYERIYQAVAERSGGARRRDPAA
jgi:glycosyltransferase involved in cell wall biosynthesis